MKKIIVALLFVVGALVLYVYKEEFLTFVSQLESFSVEKPLLAAVILIGIKIISTPLGFPGTPLTLLAGSLFGNIAGTIIALIGNTLGAVVAFVIARYVLREYVQEKFVAKYPLMKTYNSRIEQRGLQAVIALRLIPLFPFNVLNFLFGVTAVSFKHYFIGSFIGMIPGTFLFVYFGESLRMLSPLNIIFAIVGIFLLTYLGKQYEKRF